MQTNKDGSLVDKIKELIQKKPTTVSSAWKTVGKEFDVSRSTVNRELDMLAAKGEVNVEKPFPRASKIYYRKDYQRKGGERSSEE